MGGQTEGTKGKYSYGKHNRQSKAMPSCWVLQAQDTHASNQNTPGENSEIKQTETHFCSEGFFSMALRFVQDISEASAGVSFGDMRLYITNLQWPCSSFQIVCALQALSTSNIIFNLLLIFPWKLGTLEPTFSHIRHGLYIISLLQIVGSTKVHTIIKRSKAIHFGRDRRHGTTDKAVRE